MDSKLELTKSQLETILRLINDINLNGGTNEANKLALTSKVNDNSDIKMQKSTKTNLLKKRSYSAINLKNDTSNDSIINESFRRSLLNLINNSKEIKFPEIKAKNFKSDRSAINDQTIKLRRNKSLIELRKEKWDRERNELKDSDCWYEKFDSYKKKPIIDRHTRSQPDLPLGYDENLAYNRFESVSRMFSPVSADDLDNESITLNNAYSPLSSQINLNRLNSQLSGQLKKQFDQRSTNNSSPNPIFQQTGQRDRDELNQPRRSFRRYAYQFDNVDKLEKRRKQQEYQSQLEAQIAEKRAESVKEREKQLYDNRRLEAKIRSDQVDLRKEFDLDHHKGALKKDENVGMKTIAKLKKNNERKPTNELDRLEMKSKELMKVFKEASTQTEYKGESSQLKNAISTQFSDNQNSMMNRWHNTSNVLQPVVVRSNRSALIRPVTHNSRPKWTKQSNFKDEDNQTSILPKLNHNQKLNFNSRKKWNY